MDHDSAIRTLAASVTTLARIVHDELGRLGIDTGTRELLEAVEDEARAVYAAYGGTVFPDLSQGGE
jgi:hypothetical protein